MQDQELSLKLQGTPVELQGAKTLKVLHPEPIKAVYYFEETLMMMMMMMMMNCFCGIVNRRNVFSVISSQDHCQRS